MKFKVMMAACLLGTSLGAISAIVIDGVTLVNRDGTTNEAAVSNRQIIGRLTGRGWTMAQAQYIASKGAGDRLDFLRNPDNWGLEGNVHGQKMIEQQIADQQASRSRRSSTDSELNYDSEAENSGYDSDSSFNNVRVAYRDVKERRKRREAAALRQQEDEDRRIAGSVQGAAERKRLLDIAHIKDEMAQLQIKMRNNDTQASAKYNVLKQKLKNLEQ